MPFIPHTPDDVRAMLDAIGASRIEDLFDEIPAALKAKALAGIPPALGEAEVSALMQARAAQDAHGPCFIGAGAYDHHIPAVIGDLVSRGEFYSAYTPYQAEASQGTLQLIYEFQSLMVNLTGMDASNASLYDGASALSEAVLMAVRAGKRGTPRRILVPRAVNPRYRAVTRAIVKNQSIELVEIPFDAATGGVDEAALEAAAAEPFAALVIQQPNFFGTLEEVDRLTDWAHAKGALVIGSVNPVSLGLLKAPGRWGRAGADIACGEGQPLGVPLASGGPYFGFLCARKELVRQMPGRIVGRTTDLDGRSGYALTLQAREQHIRRSKATSNICTNQGLMMASATIYLSLLGPQGLARVARACHARTQALVERLSALPGVQPAFTGPRFHEAVLRLPVAPAGVLAALAARGIAGGYDLGRDYPELAGALLVCATERRTEDEIAAYAEELGRILDQHAAPVRKPGAKG